LPGLSLYLPLSAAAGSYLCGLCIASPLFPGPSSSSAAGVVGAVVKS
jgi:hypothetical protein